MFWTVEKLEARIRELEPHRYRERRSVGPLWMQADGEGAVGARPPADGDWEQVEIGHLWRGRDLYIWLRASAEVPEAWQGRTAVGLFDFGITGGGNNSKFESLLYVDGRPYQGVDSNHCEVFFPGQAAGQTLNLDFRLWSGLEGGGVRTGQEHRIRQAEMAWLDPEADDLYYTSLAALETVKLLEANDPIREMLLTALDRAFLELDWSYPGSPDFYRSVAVARNCLRQELSAMEKRHPVTVRCIGHTHIDVAWLWRLKHTREKSARSFSTVLNLMRLYPEYIFLQSQPQLYAYIKNDYPEIYAQIRERIAEGRWEAGGAMWLEADCNLTSGESLVRQILYGTRFFFAEFGVHCRYLWLPDVFGYSWALPQILRKSGIEAFMTTKISWSQYNRMPHDTFIWRGIDGSEVLTHFITTPENGGSRHYTYNGEISPHAVKGIWDAYRDKSVNRKLLLSYGFGDGGGGVTRDMLEMRRRLAEMPGLPHVETGRADEYFDALRETVAQAGGYVHRWDGELYLEYHRGTYTSQACNKRMNRKLELLFREAEWLQVCAALARSDWSGYPKERLDDGWKILLRNQFHDIIPGSSIREVYEDSRQEYKEAERLGRLTLAGAEAMLLSGGDTGRDTGGNVQTFTVFNGASFIRTDCVLVRECKAPGRWADARGGPLAAQRTEDGWLVCVEQLPPLGYGQMVFHPDPHLNPAPQAEIFHLSGRTLTTPHYVLEWNECGQLTRVFDRGHGREVLPSGERGNVLQVFEDKPLRHDAWDIDLFYREKMKEVRALQSVRLVENGPLRAAVRFEWRYGDSAIVQQMTVYKASRRIDFVTEADWRERQQLLKAAFPVAVRNTEATFDIQFGNVRRPTHWNTSWDYAKFESVAHQWADLSERGYGVSLLNDCKYGYDIRDNVLRLSLIKSAIYPDPEADLGHHAFTYALYPHEGDWFEGRTMQEAWQLNAPLAARPGACAAARFSLFSFSVDHLLVDAVKRAEDEAAVIIRLHEFAGARAEVRGECGFAPSSWTECDLLERPSGETVRGKPWTFGINPYEIKTFKLTFPACAGISATSG